MLILALQILNLSVYGSQFEQFINGTHGKKVMELNQIDSFMEYVVEIVLKHDNAFPEQKGNHTKNDSKTLKAPFQLFHIQEQEVATMPAPKALEHHSYFKINYNYLFYKEINPPPPRLA